MLHQSLYVLLTIAAQLSLLVIIARIAYLCYFHPLAHYPGPFLARFTNLWIFISFVRGSHQKVERDLHRIHGPVVRVAPNWLSFSSLEDFETIYGFHKSIEKGQFYNVGRAQRNRTRPESLFSVKSEAAHRVKRRKVQGPAFSGGKLMGYEGVIRKRIRGFLRRLEEERGGRERRVGTGTDITAGTDAAATINIAPLVHRFILATLLEIIWGSEFVSSVSARTPPSSGEVDDIDDTAFAAICADLRYRTSTSWGYSLLPWYGWAMNSQVGNTLRGLISTLTRIGKDKRKEENKQMKIVLPSLSVASQKLVFSHAEKSTPISSQPSIVGRWLDVPAGDVNRMPPFEMWAEGFNLVIAGPGSTSAALTAILFMLGSEEGQMWQGRVRREVSTDSKRDDGTAMTTSTSSSSKISPSLEAVIKETLRLYPPFSTAFPRTIMPGAEDAFYTTTSALLPAGTTVSANTYVLGRSNDLWGDDAEIWRPDRWLVKKGDDDDHEFQCKRKDLENKFVAFSKGSRGCIGKELAMLVLSRAVIAILEQWNITSLGQLNGKHSIETQYDECWVRFEPLISG